MLRTVLTAGVLTSTLFVAAPALAATPVITEQTNSVSTVYPEIDGYVDTITFGWKVDPTLGGEATLSLDVMDASTHSSVFQTSFQDVTQTNFVWNGRTAGNTIVPDGTYYVRVTADNGTDPADSNNGPSFTVSGKKMTEHTITKTVTAAASKLGRLLGPCGEIRKPGPKLGAGSLGYYPNGKCSDRQKTFAGTIHQISVPESFKPAKARLSVYGRAISKGATMKAGLAGDNGPFKLTSAKGWHVGPLLDAESAMFEPGTLGVAAVAQGSNRYEIKYFKIEYTYTSLN